ncbi:hypothetical protein K2173_007280 [Erythroxylum novogranatense]|uniref:Uncharacterized protein n=1 Tax=Erythroxylum novogranatense TaxID=1862640 RepID=A0AAV8T5T8_9ROSI|nr:hypothetical protein K2173_007280 [Erythroxylum novogranatense]
MCEIASSCNRLFRQIVSPITRTAWRSVAAQLRRVEAHSNGEESVDSSLFVEADMLQIHQNKLSWVRSLKPTAFERIPFRVSRSCRFSVSLSH